MSRLFPEGPKLEGGNTDIIGTVPGVTTQTLRSQSQRKKKHTIRRTLRSQTKNQKQEMNDATQKQPSPLAGLLQQDYIPDMWTPPPEERQKILDDHHLIGHYGADAMVADIHSKGMNWIAMRREALDTVKRCRQCQMFNISRSGFHPLKTIQAMRPGDHWAIDTAGPLPTTSRGHHFALVMVDICTRFCILRPLPWKDAGHVAEQLALVFCDFGFPQILQSDNGTEFVNDTIRLLTETCGIDHRLITAYHPRANGAAESWVKKAKETTSKRLNGARQVWDYYLPSTQLALNNKVSKRFGASPFVAMFGRRINAFKDYRSDDGPLAKLDDKDLINRIEHMEKVLFPTIRGRAEKYSKLMKEKFDKKHKLVEFPTGSHVMLRDRLNNATFRRKYAGPFKITRVTQGGSYILQDEDSQQEVPHRFAPWDLKPVSVDELEADPTAQEEHFVVDKIIDYKGTNPSNLEYLVRWKGYPPSEDSWIPPENFDDLYLVEQFWKHRDPPKFLQKSQSKRRKVNRA